MKITARFLFAAAIISISVESFAAEFKVHKGYGFITMSGEIQQGELNRLKAAVISQGFSREKGMADWAPIGTLTIISSPGGDVYEAMRMGRWIRQTGLNVTVSQRCYSSCIYLLAAGMDRKTSLGELYAEIGIHRPRFTVSPSQSIEAELPRVLSDSKRYFEEMRVPTDLAEALFSIPPDQIRILTSEEQAQYRLNQRDFVYAELEVHRLAKKHGMTRDQYDAAEKSFNRFLDSVCYKIAEEHGLNQEYNDCYEFGRKKYGFIDE